jgi:hypothetical protein
LKKGGEYKRKIGFLQFFNEKPKGRIKRKKRGHTKINPQ